MKERLELVTDFASLRAGMIVVVDGCNICRRKWCRSMLLRPIGPHKYWIPDDDCSEPVFDTIPSCCSPLKSFVAQSTVESRKVYRVIDDIEKTQSTYSRKSVTA